MIRFFCRKCGKTLRADPSIKDRSTRCTRCKAINRVPAESTRQSGEKRARLLPEAQARGGAEQDICDDEIVTLIAESDSFEGFDDLDLSMLNINTSNAGKAQSSTLPERHEVAGTASNPVHSQPTHSQPVDSGGVAIPNQSTHSIQPARATQPAAYVHRKERSGGLSSLLQLEFSSTGLIVLGAIGLILMIGYAGIRTFGSGGANAELKSEFEQSALGQYYSKALFDLKKSARVMTFIENGYKEKRLPESELKGVNEVKQRYTSLISDQTLLTRVDSLFNSGELTEVEKLITDHVNSMMELQREIERQTGWLKKKVYGR